MLRFRSLNRNRPSMRLTSSIKSRRTLLASLLALLLTGCGWLGRQAIIAYIAVDSQLAPKHVSVEIARSFIETYRDRVTIRTVFTVDKAMAEPLPPPLDGDLHFAG